MREKSTGGQGGSGGERRIRAGEIFFFAFGVDGGIFFCRNE